MKFSNYEGDMRKIMGISEVKRTKDTRYMYQMNQLISLDRSNSVPVKSVIS